MSFRESSAVAVQYPAMQKDPEKGARIRRLRTQILGIKSQQEFADRLAPYLRGSTGITRGAVGNWERGLGIKPGNMQSIAEAFNVSFEWLATGRGEPLNGQLTTPLTKSVQIGQARVQGFVEAGNWQDISDWGAFDMPTDYVPTSGDYPSEWQYAFIVNGESINKTARDGDRLVCVDLVQSHIAIRDGDLVIVERTRFGGQIMERTAKRVRKTLRGFELWPDSDHPDHQTPVEYSEDSETTDVRVLAKVVWVLRKP